MGGAKTKKKAPPKKKRATVPRSFKCPFCNHDESCEVKLDRAADTGAILCRICGEAFQCRITYMSDPVDVFCEWVDELERAPAVPAPPPALPPAAVAAAVAAAAAELPARTLHRRLMTEPARPGTCAAASSCCQRTHAVAKQSIPVAAVAIQSHAAA